MIHQVFTSFGQKEPSINAVLGCKAPDDDDGGQVGAVGSHQYCRSSQPESQWSVRERGPAMPGQFITTAKIMNPSKAELPQKGVMGCKALRGWQKENGTPDYKRLNVCFSFRRFRPDTVLEGIRPPARSRSHAGGLSILLGPRPGRSTSTHATYCKYPLLHEDDAMFCWCTQSIEHVVSGVCRWCICLYTSIHSCQLDLFPHPSSCGCEGGRVCSLTRDAIQQHSFVFYCRPKETSKFRWRSFLSNQISLSSDKKFTFIFMISGFLIEERTENCCTIFVSETIIANK